MGKSYSLFGRKFYTDEIFDDLLLQVTGLVDFRFRVESAGTSIPEWKNETNLSINPLEQLIYQPRNFITQQGDHLRISVYNTGVFEFREHEIICYPAADADPVMIRNFFLSGILACWLEWKETIVLHASSVIINGRAIAFLAHQGHGKSSMAVSLIQNGFALLTDDLLPIKEKNNNFFAMPGLPVVRLNQPEAARNCISTDQLHKVHPSANKFWVPVHALPNANFYDTPAPLSCIYLLERQISKAITPWVEIVPLPAKDVVIELLRFSYAPFLARRLKKERARLMVLSSMAREIPVRRLIYPSGFQHMPFVSQEILSDLSTILRMDC